MVWAFLAQLHAENLKVLQIFVGFIVAWEDQHKLGIVKDLPPEVSEILPEIPAFAAMIDNLVFAKKIF